jgi:hypothetical protein
MRVNRGGENRKEVNGNSSDLLHREFACGTPIGKISAVDFVVGGLIASMDQGPVQLKVKLAALKMHSDPAIGYGSGDRARLLFVVKTSARSWVAEVGAREAVGDLGQFDPVRCSTGQPIDRPVACETLRRLRRSRESQRNNDESQVYQSLHASSAAKWITAILPAPPEPLGFVSIAAL